jgi:hypothetical protein
MDSLEHQQTTAGSDDSPKLEQYLLDTIAAASSNSNVTSTVGFQSFGGNCGSSQSSQNTNDPPEMPQLMSILNELLDGQDLTSLENTGGNGDNMQDMVDQEENYEDDSPRKDDPDEITRLLVQQRLEEISRDEQQLQRKMDFLIRRLYKLVARSTGLHASEEVAGFLEHVARHYKKKEMDSKFPCLSTNSQESPLHTLTPEPPINLLSSPSSVSNVHLNNTIASNLVEEKHPNETLKPVPISEMKSFLRRIENLSTIQSSMLSKRAHALKCFTKSSYSDSLSSLINKTEASASSNTISRFEDKDLEQLDQVSGLLMSEMRIIEKQIDSDATASSSGGDSADEMVVYNNHSQQPLSM